MALAWNLFTRPDSRQGREVSYMHDNFDKFQGVSREYYIITYIRITGPRA